MRPFEIHGEYRMRVKFIENYFLYIFCCKPAVSLRTLDHLVRWTKFFDLIVSLLLLQTFSPHQLDVSIDDCHSKKCPPEAISPSVNLHKRRDSYLLSCHSSDNVEKLDLSSPYRRSPRLRRSAPVTSNNVQVRSLHTLS